MRWSFCYGVQRSSLTIDLSVPFSIFCQCTYINGSPQNTFVPGVVELAQQKKVFLGGDDFKSGQTKIKSVLVDFLVSAGIKVSLSSYKNIFIIDFHLYTSPACFNCELQSFGK